MTALAHGLDAASDAAATAREVFEKGGVGQDLPTVRIQAADIANDGISAAQLFVLSGLVSSGKEAKRLITEGGARINDAPVSDPSKMYDAAMFTEPLKLSAGKKRHALVQLSK